jgi:serine/threonine protein kinase
VLPTPLARTPTCDYVDGKLPDHWRIDGPYSNVYPHLFIGRWREHPAFVKTWLFAFDHPRWFTVTAAAEHQNLLAPFESVSVRFDLDMVGGRKDSTELIVSAYPTLSGPSVNKWARFGRATEQDLRSLLTQVAGAMKVIADVDGEAHGDAKPENVVLDARRGFVLVDWIPHSSLRGAWLGNSQEQYFCPRVDGASIASSGYISPRFRLDSVARRLTSRDDVFGLGVLAYETATGRHPFLGTSLRSRAGDLLPPARAAAQRAIALAGAGVAKRKGPPLRKARPDLPADLVGVIEGCLSLDEDARPTLEDLARGNC